MPQNGLHEKPKSLCLCRVFYPFNPVRRNPKMCVTHRNFRVDKISQYLSNFLTEFDLGNEIWQRFRYAFGMTGSYLSCVVNYYISSPMSLSLPAWWYLLLFFLLFQHSISDALIIFFESRRKQMRSETLSFVCKEKTAVISQIWEPSSAIWQWFGEMWVFLRPMHPTWWMVFSFDRQRLTEKPGWGLEMCICSVLRQNVLGICSCMHSCISVSTLRIQCQSSYCVCVLASVIWHADLEGQYMKYW